VRDYVTKNVTDATRRTITGRQVTGRRRSRRRRRRGGGREGFVLKRVKIAIVRVMGILLVLVIVI